MCPPAGFEGVASPRRSGSGRLSTGARPGERAANVEAFTETQWVTGERAWVVVNMVGELVGASPEAVEYKRSSPAWQVRGAAAHMIPRELGADATSRFDPERFRDLSVQTCSLVERTAQTI